MHHRLDLVIDSPPQPPRWRLRTRLCAVVVSCTVSVPATTAVLRVNTTRYRAVRAIIPFASRLSFPVLCIHVNSWTGLTTTLCYFHLHPPRCRCLCLAAIESLDIAPGRIGLIHPQPFTLPGGAFPVLRCPAIGRCHRARVAGAGRPRARSPRRHLGECKLVKVRRGERAIKSQSLTYRLRFLSLA